MNWRRKSFRNSVWSLIEPSASTTCCAIRTRSVIFSRLSKVWLQWGQQTSRTFDEYIPKRARKPASSLPSGRLPDCLSSHTKPGGRPHRFTPAPRNGTTSPSDISLAMSSKCGSGMAHTIKWTSYHRNPEVRAPRLSDATPVKNGADGSRFRPRIRRRSPSGCRSIFSRRGQMGGCLSQV